MGTALSLLSLAFFVKEITLIASSRIALAARADIGFRRSTSVARRKTDIANSVGAGHCAL
jgi:hypothetical protein